MRIFFVLCISIFGLNVLPCQTVFQPKKVEYDIKGILYNTERAFELSIHTNGFFVGTNFGKINSYYRTSFYHIDIGMLSDPRETRQNKNVAFPNFGISSSFIYGKQNTPFLIRLGAGEKRYLTEKAKRKGLSVGLIYEGGATVGLLKPYLLELVYQDNTFFETTIRTESYSEENHDKFISFNDIFGGAGFFKGLGGTSVIMGAHAKAAAHFAFGAFDQYVKAVDIGLQLDFFPTKLPILVERDDISNRRLFLNLYLNLHFGKRK